MRSFDVVEYLDSWPACHGYLAEALEWAPHPETYVDDVLRAIDTHGFAVGGPVDEQ